MDTLSSCPKAFGKTRLEAIEAFNAIEDNTACAAAVSKGLEQWPEHHSRLREIRQARVQALRGEGKTWREIGEALGESRRPAPSRSRPGCVA